MNSGKWILLLLSGLLAGCAVQENFAVDKEFWTNKSARIGVVICKPPVVKSLKMGQQEVFDVTRNDPATRDLEKFLATQNLSSINKVADGMVEYLQKQGLLAKRIPGYFEPHKLPRFDKNSNAKTVYAQEDYWVNKEKWGVEKVVVLTVDTVGITRTYHANDPTGEPNGYASISGMIVNLATNKLEWRQSVIQSVPVDNDDWDSPPKYPGLARAIATAYTQAQVVLFNYFAK